MPQPIPGIKVIRHTHSNVREPDDESYPWRLLARLRVNSLQMNVAATFLFGPEEIIEVVGKTEEALQEAARRLEIDDKHPRLLEFSIKDRSPGWKRFRIFNHLGGEVGTVDCPADDPVLHYADKVRAPIETLRGCNYKAKRVCQLYDVFIHDASGQISSMIGQRLPLHPGRGHYYAAQRWETGQGRINDSFSASIVPAGLYGETGVLALKHRALGPDDYPDDAPVDTAKVGA